MGVQSKDGEDGEIHACRLEGGIGEGTAPNARNYLSTPGTKISALLNVKACPSSQIVLPVFGVLIYNNTIQHPSNFFQEKT